MNRRQFLTGSVAVLAVAPSLPASAAVQWIGVDMAAGPDLMAFAIGTPGEMDWQPVFASSMDDAIRQYCTIFGIDDAESAQINLTERVCRCQSWDGKRDRITDADWLREGMGSNCFECGEPAFLDEGALIDGDNAICGECVTLQHRVSLDRDGAIEELADQIAGVGLDGAQAWVGECGFDVPGDIWLEAVARAS